MPTPVGRIQSIDLCLLVETAQKFIDLIMSKIILISRQWLNGIIKKLHASVRLGFSLAILHRFYACLFNVHQCISFVVFSLAFVLVGNVENPIYQHQVQCFKKQPLQLCNGNQKTGFFTKLKRGLSKNQAFSKSQPKMLRDFAQKSLHNNIL